MNKIATFAIGTALLLTATPAFAETASTTTDGHMMGASKAVNYTCVQTAVDVREGAIDTAFGTYSAAMTAALSARKSALHDAWGLADATARRNARNAAWSAYKAASKTAHSDLKTSRNLAWSAFRTASKACGTTAVESASSDGVGSIGL